MTDDDYAAPFLLLPPDPDPGKLGTELIGLLSAALDALPLDSRREAYAALFTGQGETRMLGSKLTFLIGGVVLAEVIIAPRAPTQ